MNFMPILMRSRFGLTAVREHPHSTHFAIASRVRESSGSPKNLLGGQTDMGALISAPLEHVYSSGDNALTTGGKHGETGKERQAPLKSRRLPTGYEHRRRYCRAVPNGKVSKGSLNEATRNDRDVVTLKASRLGAFSLGSLP